MRLRTSIGDERPQSMQRLPSRRPTLKRWNCSRDKAMKAARKDFEAEFEALHSEAGHRRKMVDELLKETKAECERLTESFAEVEAERDELEHGILRARDIVAAKDAELRKATEKARMTAGEAVAESLRLTEGQIKSAAEEARREAEARLSSQFAADLKLAVEAAAREGKASAASEVRGDTRSYVDKLEASLAAARIRQRGA